jgi:hypothetical protein
MSLGKNGDRRVHGRRPVRTAPGRDCCPGTGSELFERPLHPLEWAAGAERDVSDVGGAPGLRLDHHDLLLFAFFAEVELQW